MDHSGIISRWPIWFPHCPPYQECLRYGFPDRWLRVHSLPEAKRYATNDEERLILLERHAAVSTSVLGDNALCAVVLTYSNGYGGEHEPLSVRRLGPTVVRGWETEWAADNCFTDYLEQAVFAVASCIWRRGQFNDVILDVAEDDTAPLFFVALNTGRIYAPYDGGADLFVENEAARDALRSEFSEWISKREDGL